MLSAAQRICTIRKQQNLIRTVGDPAARGARLVRGVASTVRLDSYGTRLWPFGLEAALPLPLLRDHDDRQKIGDILCLEVFDSCVVVTAALNRDDRAENVWRSMEGNALRALSVRFNIKQVVEYTFYSSITQWRLGEVSVVDTPANADTWLSRYSAPVRLKG